MRTVMKRLTSYFTFQSPAKQTAQQPQGQWLETGCTHQVSSPGPPHSNRHVWFLNWFDLSLWASVRAYSKLSSTNVYAQYPLSLPDAIWSRTLKFQCHGDFWMGNKSPANAPKQGLRCFCDICVWRKLSSEIHRLFSSKLVNIITEFSVELSRHEAVCCAIFPQTSCFNVLKTRLPSPHEKSLQRLHI